MRSQAELKNIASALKRLEQSKLSQAFDPAHPDSRPTKKQELIMSDINKVQYRYVVAGNQSGKSQLAARDLTWFLNGEHPYFKRPEEWGTEPLTVIIAVQDLNLGYEIWRSKVKPFLKDEWKEERQGNSLKKCISKRTGDAIYFLSHSDGSEKNRKHMQGYVAHYLWLDEMPTSHKILEELQRRVDARKGRFLATFTPKFRNDTVRRMIDASEAPVAKKYQMSKLDNPIYSERLEEELQKLNGLSESEKKTILYGDWSTGEDAVYHFNYDSMVVSELPEGYNPGWRHAESVDPALRSKCGYTLWAEHPATGVWYLVNDQYISGSTTLDAEELFRQVQERSNGYNIVRRLSDTMAWYISAASKYGVTYMTPYRKNDRKQDLIKGLQTALSSGKIKIASWCVTFIDEVQSCQWSETTDRIVNSSSFHTLDAAQYFCDNIPKYDPANQVLPWHAELRKANNDRKSQNKIYSGGTIKRGSGARPMSGWSARAGRRTING